MTWCNGRSVNEEGPLDFRDCAEAPQFFIIWIYEFSLTWILLLNKQQSIPSFNGCLDTIWFNNASRQSQFQRQTRLLTAFSG